VYAEFLKTTATSQPAMQSVAEAIKQRFVLPEKFLDSFREGNTSAREQLERHQLPPWIVDLALEYAPFKMMAKQSGTQVRPRMFSA
jgi:hypothetical protein